MIPLYIAAEQKSTTIAQLFLQHNADIEAKGQYNQTPLVTATHNNKSEVAELINADIETNKEFKHRPIYLVTYSNSTEIADVPLQHNTVIEAKDLYNRAPLAIAAYSNSVEIAELLL